ncbi:MAG: sulfatase [Verrucomicrobia bacterium]|nr:sulfatase [Verrucomicrobiota bacterium]
MIALPSAFSVAKKKKSIPAPVPGIVPRAVPVVEHQPAPGKGPNILFIIVDNLNDWCGPLGGHPQARTPNLDRLAKSGMTFTNAHGAYAQSNASRTALFSGVNPWNNGVWSNEQDWRHSVPLIGQPVLPEYFRAQGWFTSASGKIFHASSGGPEGRLTGWQGGRRGFELDHAWNERLPGPGVQIPDLPVHTGQNFNGLSIWHWDWSAIDKQDGDMDDAKVASWAGDFLQRRFDRPFFLAVGFNHPHSPWYAPRKYFEMFPLDQIKLPKVTADDLIDVPEIGKAFLKSGDSHKQIVERNLWRQAVQAYLANIAFADAMIGRVLDALERSPQREKTVVVLTSDRGSYLGQKQRWDDGGLWEEATRVPLIVSVPGVTQPGTTSAQPVSLVDLYPTLVEIAGLTKPEHLDGESFVSLLRDPLEKRGRPAVMAMGGDDHASYAVRSERWRYIRYHDGSEELYDHSNDPREWNNLAAKLESKEIKQTLAAALPKEWHSAHRPIEDVSMEHGADDSMCWSFFAGDCFSGKTSPDITGRSFAIEAEFEYNPEVDRDATVISQGGPELGWAVHLVDGRPAFTVNYDGLRATLKTDEPLKSGHIILRGLFGADGTLGVNATGIQNGARGYAPMEGGFPRQPEQGLCIGESFGPLASKLFPNSSPFNGIISHVHFTLLPKQ